MRTDPAAPQRLWPLPVWLALHGLLWTGAAWLSRGNLDVPGDMVENYVWGIEWQGGYAKHPPLFAWITAAWFAVFPRVDAAYFLLSALNAAIGLAGVAALARRFLLRDEALVATLALAVSPLYTALAIKFNANAVLLSTWPWAAYGFAALMQTGRLRHALVCGVFTALAVLGKYFSVVLVLGFVLATLARPAWRARLLGPAPWVAVVTAALVLAPHAVWQVRNDFATFGYASQRSGGGGWAGWIAAVLRYAKYVLAQVGYLLPSFVLLLLVVPKGQRRRWCGVVGRSLTGPRGASRAYSPTYADLWWLAFAPLLAAGVLAVGAKVPMASVWGMAQWFALTTLWLWAAREAGVGVDLQRLPRVALGYALLVAVGAAAVGWNDARRGAALAAEPRQALAAAARQQWHDRTGQPLRIVGGSVAESASVVFYGAANERMHWWHDVGPALTPWVTPERLAQDGALLVCREDDAACHTRAGLAMSQPAIPVSLQQQRWGRDQPPHRYTFYVLLPSRR